jgi:hypothetical protein
MVDVSATGMRLILETPAALPDHIILLLSHDGQLRRQCSVAWQSGTTAGVHFISGRATKRS